MRAARNTRKVRTIYRVEHPETGAGAYAFMYPSGSNRSTHPASYCPPPDSDSRLQREAAKAMPEFARDSRYAPAFDFYEILGRGEAMPEWRMVGSKERFRDLTSPWHFGFPNRRYLNAWFSQRDRKMAKASGLVLAVYEVHPSACLIGDSQAIFFMPCARRVALLPLR